VHFPELVGGGAEVLGAQDIGDAFDHGVFAEVAVGEAIAVVSVSWPI
jgi:hypothetical protein